jgi:hypothetical protein
VVPPSSSLSAVHTPRVLLPAVWALPRSLAATWGIDVSFFSSGYLDVSVRRVPSRTLWIHVRVTASSTAGFPHSDIHGSKPACGSPWLFAACCVLRRLPVPRHSPYALFRLIFNFRNCSPFALLFACSLSSSSLYALFKVRCFGCVVGSSGLEPPASRLSGVRSHQLSYEPPHLPWWR